MKKDSAKAWVFNESVLTVSVHSETLIDECIENVWPQALDVKSWMNLADLQTVSGVSNNEAELVKVANRKFDESAPLPHHHFYRVISVVPMKQVVLSVFPEIEGSYGFERMNFFDIVTVYENDGSTIVAFDMNGEIVPKEPLNKDQLLELGDGITKGSQEKSAIHWANLRELVDKAASKSR